MLNDSNHHLMHLTERNIWRLPQNVSVLTIAHWEQLENKQNVESSESEISPYWRCERTRNYGADAL